MSDELESSVAFKVVQAQLSHLTSRLEEGLEALSKQRDEARVEHNELEERVRKLELHGLNARTLELQRRLARIEARTNRAAVNLATAAARMKWVVGIASAIATIFGVAIVRLLAGVL